MISQILYSTLVRKSCPCLISVSPFMIRKTIWKVSTPIILNFISLMSTSFLFINLNLITNYLRPNYTEINTNKTSNNAKTDTPFWYFYKIKLSLTEILKRGGNIFPSSIIETYKWQDIHTVCGRPTNGLFIEIKARVLLISNWFS